MPRIPRGDSANGIYHIINRGNMRMQQIKGTGYFIFTVSYCVKIKGIGRFLKEA